MLLRLVPPAPLPTILFTLSFPTLPQSIPLPAAWDLHLQLLLHYQLAAPPSLHALDKSVAWTALLETVTFDLVSYPRLFHMLFLVSVFGSPFACDWFLPPVHLFSFRLFLLGVQSYVVHHDPRFGP